jgi:hypothetical protein
MRCALHALDSAEDVAAAKKAFPAADGMLA